ncbi:Fungal Zn(2)-Cys(6) binuclear cluster domain-containing protein [Penicillium ucsense]|uniref:Fungal Zn(2)-Cys(6) binuclear cluster domain-containing protein n=1 Tax=Penicillium ucsense TaxID=2839758 RepID=A0A8J8WHG3_9EURO|nr:Fungal Zn(2)-Cys(6) binuclear cluster domain-containing protein [Penicillium ucsense]KAF7734017.1 Fungal Zn(2)-Cys(6) binuclear cluster domain-containing protein [Penicillium ucsense]
MERTSPTLHNLLLQPSEGTNRFPRLPACRFCHARKAKCDNARPKCSLCMKHDEECMTLGLDESESFSRQYIGDLEEEIRKLEAQAQRLDKERSTPTLATATATQSPLQARSAALPPDGSNLGRQDDAHSPNFVEGGGISFMRHLVADCGWREHDPTLLQNLTRTTGPAEAGIKPLHLPPAQEGRKIFENYLNGSHVQNPFLLRRDVQRLCTIVFPSQLRTSESGNQHNHTQHVSDHDLFRAFMILAVGSVVLYRNGASEHHPYGYYLSAMKYLDDTFFAKGVESIQDLLLVGRFAIYHHIGTSIWEILRLCMRLCIEQGLHKPPPPALKISLLEAQLQRRVFWECYMIDRYSSSTLDRPCAIADRHIQIGFPADANDEDIEAADASGSFPNLDSFRTAVSLHSPSDPGNTEMSVFFACLRLRQITSAIHSTFTNKTTSTNLQDKATARGTIYAALDELLSELHQWRCQTPKFSNPRSLYEMQDWYDLLYYRERLQLVRKAIDLVPKRKSILPRDLLSLCLQCATGAISAFWKLFEPKKVTFTRSYFQMLFTAGLSIMYCLSVVGDFDNTSMRAGTEAVITCESILKQMGVHLSDAKRYVAVYEALRGYVIRKYSRHLQAGEQPAENSASSLQAVDPHSLFNSTGLHDGRSHNLGSNTRDTLNDGMGYAHSSANQGLNGFPLFDNAQLMDHSIMHDSTGSFYNAASISDGSVLSWNIFGDDALWNMEAGLNEYAYGDPPASLYLEDPMGLQDTL